jgi:glutamine amidotransferase
MITVIDYGVGNIKSIRNMIEKIGAPSVITNKKKLIEQSTHIVLPGVGHFDFGMKKLDESGLLPILKKKVFENKTPILGICLGAQLMTNRSDEGTLPGLGWIEAETVAFDKSKLPEDHKIPHMGWNYVSVVSDAKLFNNMYENPRFYFVHSYHLKLSNRKNSWLNAYYGYDFCAAYHKDNIYACQFHPEKSHKFGLRLMENFINL